MSLAVGVMADSYNKPAAGGGFPSTLVGLSAWFDAADDTKFTYGTGTQVTGWTDKSANAFVVTRADNVNVYRSDTINGLKCVTFTNATMQLNRAATTVRTFVDQTNYTDCMSFAVLQMTSTAAGGYWMLNGATYRVTFQLATATSYFDVANSSTGRLSGAPGTAINTTYVIAVYRNGANMKMFRNGVEVLTKSNASGSVGSTETATLAVAGANASGLLGKFCELVHVSRYNAADFTATQQYLATKWGVTLP